MDELYRELGTMADPLITPAILGTQCVISIFAGPIGNRADWALVRSLKRLAGIISTSAPEKNHYLLRATQRAYVAAMQEMAEVCGRIALDEDERTAAAALKELSRSKTFTEYRSTGEHFPLEETNAQIDRMFGGGLDSLEGIGTADMNAAYNRVVVADLAAWGIHLPQTFEILFVDGLAEHSPWHLRLRVLLGEQLVNDAAFRAIFTAERLGELRAQGIAIIGGVEALRGDLATGFADVGHKLDVLAAGVVVAPAEAGPPPTWIDQATDQPLLDSGMPPAGRSALEVAAKAQLYGGKPVLRFSALEFVALGHAFDRQRVTEFAARIRANERSCSSFTLRAIRGTGLSLALAQLVRDFDGDPRAEVLSVVGDRQRTLKLLEVLDKRAAATIDWLKSLTEERDRVLIVIDDVRGDQPIADGNLIRFRNRCADALARSDAPKLTLVFGSIRAAKTLHEDGEVFLKLTEEDRAACYSKMAEAEPTIIKGCGDGLPPEARQLGDDAQALIDFYLQHGRPHQATVQHWLARVDDLPEAQQSVLACVATGELLDLPIPEKVAIALCLARNVYGVADAEEIVATNDRLAVVDADGPAVGLSCPWRAKSILQRTDRLTIEFLQPTFEELVTAALGDIEARGGEAAQSLDFARHILQRLGKREFYPFPDKGSIGRQIAAQFLDRIAGLSRGWSIAERAKWAGTVAVWVQAPRRRSPEPEEDRDLRTRLGEFVGRLTEMCVRSVARGQATLTAPVAVSLLRAARLLLASGLYPPSRIGEGPAQLLARHLDFRIRQTGMPELLERELSGQAEDRSYRANELITAYSRFRAELHAASGGDIAFPSKALCREMTQMLETASRILNQHLLTFDAGTRIECARFVWTDFHNPRQLEWAARERGGYLRGAMKCVEMHPVTLATWERRVKGARIKLLDPLAHGHGPGYV